MFSSKSYCVLHFAILSGFFCQKNINKSDGMHLIAHTPNIANFSSAILLRCSMGCAYVTGVMKIAKESPSVLVRG